MICRSSINVERRWRSRQWLRQSCVIADQACNCVKARVRDLQNIRGLHVDDNASLQEFDTVLTAACRLACGIRAMPTKLAWQHCAGVKPHVMLSDVGMLPTTDMACVACLRYAERMRVADAHACTLHCGNGSTTKACPKYYPSTTKIELG